MNRTTQQPVPEHSQQFTVLHAHSASAGTSIVHGRAEASSALQKNLLLSAIACVFPNVAWALPESGQVIAGSATFESPDANTLTINQLTNQSIINWQRFSIAGDEYVQFIQPSTSSISLNRVIGGDPSTILGQLSANGQVYLVNPNGIYFGQNVRVDVSGLVASVMDIDDADFMAGNYVFSRVPGAPSGQVINDGVITAREKGYVVLMGDYAANNGIIQAHMGEVVLASGSHVTLDISGNNLVSVMVDEATVADLAGVDNTGEIYADGGRVIMTAKVANDLIGSVVNNSGRVQANSIVEHDGAIFLTAEGGDITNSGTLDASAAAGSNVDGGGVLVYSDRDVTLSSGGVIAARGDGSGSGGIVRTIAEQRLDHRSGASIDVSGADKKGGFVELSGHDTLAIRGQVELGSGGELLIDPGTLTILNGNNLPGFTTGGSPTPTNGFVGKGFLETQLNGNVNITLVADNNITAGAGTLGGSAFTISATTGSGNLSIVNGAVTSGGGTFGACTLTGVCLPGGSNSVIPNATGSINLGTVNIQINGSLTVSGGSTSGNVTLGGIDVGGNVSITAGNNINLNGNVSQAGSSFVASAGNDLTVSGGFGSSPGNRIGANVRLQANNNVNINSDIFHGGNNLELEADADSSNLGDVNVAPTETQPRIISTLNQLTVSGQNFNVTGAATSGFVGGTSQIFIEADDGNALTTSDNITINLAGAMNVIGGAGVARATSTLGSFYAFPDVSVNVIAGNDISVTAGTLNVKGGSMTATSGFAFTSAALSGHANANLSAGRDMSLNIANSLNVTGGTADARVNSTISSAIARADAKVSAGRNMNVTVTGGDVTVNGGNATATETFSGCAGTSCMASASAIAGFEAGSQLNLNAMAGNILLGQGVENTSFFPNVQTQLLADAGAYLSAAELAVDAALDIAMSGSLKNTGAAGGAAWTMTAGNNIFIGADQGSAASRFNDALTLSAGNHIDIYANIYLANRTLTLAADSDGNGVGNVTVMSQPEQSVMVDTRGTLNVSGQDFNVQGASFAGFSSGAPTSAVFVIADDGNVATTTDNINVSIAGDMNVIGGTGTAFMSDGGLTFADVSANVFAGNDIVINADSLNVLGGNATGTLSTIDTVSAYADAKLIAGRNIVATLAGNLNVQGGAAAASSAFTPSGSITAEANAELAAVGNVTVNAGGSVNLSNGSVISTVNPSITTALLASAGIRSQGNMNLTAGTSMSLSGDVDVGGSSLQLAAGTDLTINTDLGLPGGTAAKAAAATIPLGADTSLSAGNNVFIFGNIYVPNNSLSITAGTDIFAEFSQIMASGLYMQAGANIDLVTTDLFVGTGTVPGVTGDALVLQAMQASGIPLPASSDPNLKMEAGGYIDVRNIDVSGSSAYLWLSADGTTTIGSISAPTGANLLLQYSPLDPTKTIGFEDLPDIGQAVNYSNQDNVAPFPITTLVIGSSLHTGDIVIGANDMIDIGSKNIVAATLGGNIDSLNNVTTTGVVASLQQSVFVTPRLDDISVDVDGTEFDEDEEDKRKKLISQEEEDESSNEMCAGQ